MGRCRSCTVKKNAYHRPLLMLLAGCVLIALPLRAQVVEINPTISSIAAPLPADDNPSGGGFISGQLGEYNLPFEFSLHLSMRGASDDNIGLTHMNRLDDWFVQIQPALMLGIGEVAKQETFLMVNYLPNIFRYDDHREFNSDQHIIRVVDGYKTTNLTLRLSQDVAILNNIVLAATSGERLSLVPSGRTDLNIYNTDLSANYKMTLCHFNSAELRASMTASWQ